MFEPAEELPRHPVVAQFQAAVDALLAIDLSALSPDELLCLTRDAEIQRRRLPVFDHRVIAEMKRRNLAKVLSMRTVARVLVALLRLSPYEARRRVEAADRLGERLTLTGAPLEPMYPVVAAAQADGLISAEHASTITAAIEDLPDPIRAEHGDAAERVLTDRARIENPFAVARAAISLGELLNPDGIEPADAELERRRELVIHARPNGTARVSGVLTPDCAAAFQAVIGTLARPRPEADGSRDERSAGQRNHDALLDACHRLLRSGTLPDSGGSPVTILVTVTLTDLMRRLGLARTSTGAPISVARVVEMAAEAEIIPVFMNDTGGVMAYGRGKRLATAAQRRALFARDGGCSRPGCAAPPDWCEAHHLPEFDAGGTTDIDTMALACRYDHRIALKQGWEVKMIDGVPHWRAPAWIDPTRTWRRNTTHHPKITFD